MRILSSERGRKIFGRTGVTLTEVLMSLMIMSIGVVSVATLFPIAALRSAQATRLTNGAILKYNVEALVQAQPELLFDPDGNFVPGSGNFVPIAEHFRATNRQRYVIDPVGYFASAVHDTTFIDDYNNPATLGVRNFLGASVNISGATPTFTRVPVLERYDGGLRSGSPFGLPADLSAFQALATDMANLGDGWDTIVDDIAVSPVTEGGNIVGINLDTEIDTDAVVSSAAYEATFGLYADFTRITVFSADGRISNSWPLTFKYDDPANINPTACLWTETAVSSLSHPATDYDGDGAIEANGLPAEFGGSVGRVLIQKRRTADFNWLLTVRRGADGRAIGTDVVVIFGGARNPENEHVYATLGIDGDFNVDSDGSGGVMPTDAEKSNDIDGGFVANQFRIVFTYDATMPEPFLKRGGYVLDIVNARWYRIADYSESTNAATTTVTLKTESEIVESTAAGSGLILLPGVVDVYPLGTYPLPEEMSPLSF